MKLVLMLCCLLGWWGQPLWAEVVVDDDPVEAPESATSSSVLIRHIEPSATDPAIDTATGDGYQHWVYWDPAAPKRRELLVFIPGTGNKGAGSRAFNTVAAKAGYHLVSLAYPSNVSMSVFHNLEDPDAFQKARENLLYGKEPYRRLHTTSANSIVHRLVALLEYLQRTYPDEGWGTYLTAGNEPDWEHLILAGSSQGGGHAALLSVEHRVARVLMFGAPKDFNVHDDHPAAWYGLPHATPLERCFCFTHLRDEGHGCTYAQQLENYRAFGLSPEYPVINVDDQQPPYGHSHLLTSGRPEGNPHGSVIKDPAFAATWEYLLSEPCP